MDHGRVGVIALLPAHQPATAAIHPAVCALHHPASGFEVRMAHDRLGFFATRANVGRKARLFSDGAHLIVVIAGIQAQPQGTSQSLRGCEKPVLGLASRQRRPPRGATHCAALWKALSATGRPSPAGFAPNPTVSFLISILCGYCGPAGRTFPVPEQTGRQGEGTHQVMRQGVQQKDALREILNAIFYLRHCLKTKILIFN